MRDLKDPSKKTVSGKSLNSIKPLLCAPSDSYCVLLVAVAGRCPYCFLGHLLASETEREILEILGVPWQEPHERVRANFV